MDLQIPEKRAKLENKDVSTGWFDLPLEMREAIFREMDFKTMCVFRQCSKICHEEVKASKEFKIYISIDYCKLGFDHKTKFTCYNQNMYYLEFVEKRRFDPPKTEVIYSKSLPKCREIEKWKRLENGDAQEVQMRYFDDYIEEYCDNIHEIEIYDGVFPHYDMRKLRNIKKIGIFNGYDILKSGVFDLSQITNADTVWSGNTKVTIQQVIDLKGTCYELTLDGLYNEQTIGRYLEMMKNGEINNNLEFIRLHVNLGGFPRKNIITEGLEAFDVYDQYSDGSDGERELFAFASDSSRTGFCKCVLTRYYVEVDRHARVIRL